MRDHLKTLDQYFRIPEYKGNKAEDQDPLAYTEKTHPEEKERKKEEKLTFTFTSMAATFELFQTGSSNYITSVT